MIKTRANSAHTKPGTLVIDERDAVLLKSHMRTYEDHKRDIEAVIVIAVPVSRSTEKYAWQTIFKPGKEMSYPDYFKHIVDIPLDWIAEEILVYSVSQK